VPAGCTLAGVAHHWLALLHWGHVMQPTADGWDTTAANLGTAPAGQGATYTTGGDGIAASAAQLAAHPGIVRICQDAGATDDTADELDVERGAATPADAPDWVLRARSARADGTRPGQREPSVYVGGDNLAALLNALVAGEVGGTVWIHIAHWGVTQDEAAHQVGSSTGDRPLSGFQYAHETTLDRDVWSKVWLDTATAAKEPAPAPATGNWTEKIVTELPTVKLDDTGAHVRTVQGLLLARGEDIGETGELGNGVDGTFGAETQRAVVAVQRRAKLTDDGIVGPETWPALLGT